MGYTVPTKIVNAAVINNRLFKIRKKSLLKNLYLRIPFEGIGFSAKIDKLTIIYIEIKVNIKIPLFGSVANA